MSSPVIEAERLAALHALDLIGTAAERHFDAVCRTARDLFSVPIALVTLVDSDRVWTKARCGIEDAFVSRDIAFCAQTIESDAPLVIEDAAADPAYRDNPLVQGDLRIRFYAGIPLVLRNGIRLGTLCVMDTRPRRLSPSEIGQLHDLSEIVLAHLRLHDTLRAKTRADLALSDSEARYHSLTESLPQMVWVLAGEERRTTYRNACFRSYYGEDGAPRDIRHSRNHPDDVARMSRVWMEAVAAGRTFEVEGRLRRHDGVYRWHKLVMIPVHRDGRVAEWIGTALDIDDIIVARDRLSQTSDLLQLAQQAAGAAVWEWDLAHGVLRHSPESARMIGLDVPPGATTVTVDANHRTAPIHPDDRAAVEAADHDAIRTGAANFGVEFRVLPRAGAGAGSGSCRWLMSFGRIIRDEATGVPSRIVGLNLDVTELRMTREALVESEGRLRVSEERLALALDSGSDGLWDLDVASGAYWLSDRCYTMLGYAVGAFPGTVRTWAEMVHPDDRAQALRTFEDHLAGTSAAYECEHRVETAEGRYAWILSRGRVVTRDGEGRPLRMVGTHIDVTARKEAERRVNHMAHHDALTDLPNRILFHEHLDRHLAEVKAGRGRLALLFLDLDRFKTVNDTLGHLAGDALLATIAGRLRAAVGEAGTVARLGGDEFAVIAPAASGTQETAALAQRIIDAVGEPVDLSGRMVTIGASVGITLAPDDGLTAGVLLKNADISLYRSKAAGRNTYHFHETGMDAAIADRNRLEFDLREAVIGGALGLAYQPVMTIADGTVCGFEALMRWRHPSRGMVSPEQFIPLAEETGLIVPLGIWALREACREAASWPGDLRIAVNVSTLQFQQPGLEESVVAALAASGLAPQRLELEITESVLMHEADSVIACLTRLRALGVRIALDDFGTGYSSLSYLRRFPFDKIKIDRSFIWDIADPDAAAVVRAVVGLGMRRGTTITAEGVETQEQFESVRREGCTEVQGYLFSRPLPAEEARAFVRERPRRAAA
ncbi:EAL domain-containing protein [Methylobacterium sp. Leaf466]|uniref:bifunctional diguanylate cyclase/phosphodiesterase n=1 Tax=Methylobacterium sp. Leaf466 TaxID=1736386 RepID=UPI0006F83C55|nr:EAL domain-containing protein [Methylobacterium sp. Leaf466]KQT83764.1 diguanylate cyclase [Methylobacterium sp. Leaf466]